MAAQFKSNVRLREEKGLGSVSMKRLIFCGVGAVLLFMILRLTPLSGAALPLLVATFVTLLILTGLRGGLPLWQRLLLGFRGSIVLSAARNPNGFTAQLAQMLNLEPDIAHLHQEVIFKPKINDPDTADWSEWAIFADLAEAENANGLSFVTPEQVFDEVSHDKPF